MFLVVPTFRHDENLFEDWMFVLFVLCLIFFAYYSAFYSAKINNVIRGFRSDVLMRQLMREENITPRSHFFLGLLHAVSLSLLVVLTLIHFFSFQASSWNLFFLFGLGILLVYALKWMGLRIAYWLLDGDFTLGEYSYRTFATNRLLGMVLFPLLIGVTLTDKSALNYALIIIWLIIGIAWFWRVLKGAWVAFQARVPLFFIFFYICTLEILPITVGFKIFFNSIGN